LSDYENIHQNQKLAAIGLRSRKVNKISEFA